MCFRRQSDPNPPSERHRNSPPRTPDGQPVGSSVGPSPTPPPSSTGGEHRKCIATPFLTYQPARAEFLTQPPIASASWRVTRCGRVISPSSRTASPGPGNGCFHQISSGRPAPCQSGNFVLKRSPQRFNQPKGHLFRQSTNVMMRFDGRRGPLHGTTRLRPDKGSPAPGTNLAMGSQPGASCASSAKTAMNLCPNALALFLGVRNPFQLSEEAFRSVHADDVDFAGRAASRASLQTRSFSASPYLRRCSSAGFHRAVHEHGRTVESTPPLSPQMAHLFHLLADRTRRLLDKGRAAPLWLALHTRNRKSEQSVPRSVWFTSGETRRVNFFPGFTAAMAFPLPDGVNLRSVRNVVPCYSTQRAARPEPVNRWMGRVANQRTIE